MNIVRQFDNFSQDIDAVRSGVIAGGFSTETGPDGGVYTGISRYPDDALRALIAEKIGEPIIPRLSCFRLNLAGELPHSWVHSDNACSSRYASVLYLNLPEQCKGGTAFWKHKTLGIESLPTPEDLAGEGISNPESFYSFIVQEWKKLDAWEKVGLAEMKFNRFITYPTCLFHSRYPFEAFGSGPSDGRLIWVCFYDKEKEVKQ